MIAFNKQGSTGTNNKGFSEVDFGIFWEELILYTLANHVETKQQFDEDLQGWICIIPISCVFFAIFLFARHCTEISTACQQKIMT